ncbi:MAG TPA: Gfo/Idh/MocA family oxidoreductase [Opitutales bacterium]|nr:Gfo/Idh/MocA family oxidoreductase [Opitutales bacterium]
MERREFIKAAAAATMVAAVPYIGKAGLKDKVRMGFIGIGSRGTQVMRLFQTQPDVEVVALCDVYEPYLYRDQAVIDPLFAKYGIGAVPKFAATDKFGPNVRRYTDYRKLLEDQEVDAVMIATPDHWHAIMTIDAMKAGKDVYCEKPLSMTIREGRRMIEVQKETKQVCAVGLNRRASVAYQTLKKEIDSGRFGKFRGARAARISNISPNGIGRCPDMPPPKGMHWDKWIGPRQYRPYRYTTAPYYFRWHPDFSSQMGNWGVHFCDVMRWMLDEEAPSAITASGGKYFLDHDGEIDDTDDVTFEFADGKMCHFSIYEGGTSFPIKQREVEYMGTDGVAYANELGFDMLPHQKREFVNPKAPVFEAYHFSHKEEMLPDGSWGGSTLCLVRDFLDCVQSRKEPICPLEIGHRSTSFALLANIALKMKQRLEWDPVKERFTNCGKANEFLHYDYREGYKLG